MTDKEFLELPAGEIFAVGMLPNMQGGLYMFDTCVCDMCKWVAVKGRADDWTIYRDWAYKSDFTVRHYGHKVFLKSDILKCVPCDDAMYKRYRY